MIRNYTIIEDTATCQDCGAIFKCTANAQALAAKHAQKTGHRVTGEKSILYSYDGKL